MAENNEFQTTLEGLRARRDALSRAIEALEAISGEWIIPIGFNPNIRVPAATPPEIQHDTFVGRNVAEAAAMYLGMVGRPARSLEEIHNALTRGGLNSTPGTMQTLLSRSHNGPNPVVFRAGRGTWGLPEWYQAKS